MNRPVYPVILAGGIGSRLWPLSREQQPKQFMAPGDDGPTLLQATLGRLDALGPLQAPVVVCNREHRFIASDQVRAAGITPGIMVLEPVGRSTAPAVAAAALEVLQNCRADEQPILLVLPADHFIGCEEALAEAVRTALDEAAAGRMVMFGVAPDGVETGYGYIRAGAGCGEAGIARTVEEFVEKPDARRAAAWTETEGWYWNSGMFVFGASHYLQELALHAADVRDAVGAAHDRALRSPGFLELDEASLSGSPVLSVDHAVMEHTRNAVVVPLDAGWSDLGSWAALSELSGTDEAGNITRGDVMLEGTRDSYVRSTDRLTAVVGVKDLVVVDTADALLVADRNAAGNVSAIVERLRRAGRDEYGNHRKVRRPWGSYDTVHDGDGFKVKHITVNPGQRLSLQMHRHRAEHWVVVRGTALVTRNDENLFVSEGQSVYLPQGARHRVENPGESPLEFIEVQMGACLDEDDIIRFEDDYGRADDGGVPAGASTESEKT